MSEGPIQEEQRTWIKRNALWFLPAILLLGIAAFFATGIYYVHVAKQSVPYNMALELVQADATVRQKLGEPVESTWRPPDGEQAVLETGSGTADRKFDIVGPKGTARVSVLATCEQYYWTLNEVKVKVVGDRQPFQVELPPEDDPRRTRKEENKTNLIDPY